MSTRSTTIWDSKTDLGPTEKAKKIVIPTIPVLKVVGVMAPIVFGPIVFDKNGRIAKDHQNPLVINRVFKHESNPITVQDMYSIVSYK